MTANLASAIAPAFGSPVYVERTMLENNTGDFASLRARRGRLRHRHEHAPQDQPVGHGARGEHACPVRRVRRRQPRLQRPRRTRLVRRALSARRARLDGERRGDRRAGDDLPTTRAVGTLPGRLRPFEGLGRLRRSRRVRRQRARPGRCHGSCSQQTLLGTPARRALPADSRIVRILPLLPTPRTRSRGGASSSTQRTRTSPRRAWSRARAATRAAATTVSCGSSTRPTSH